MAATLLEGTPLAEKIKAGLKAKVSDLKAKGTSLKVRAVQLGQDPSSVMYVQQQAKSFQEIGVGYEVDQMALDASLEAVLAAIGRANADPLVTGLILQTPLPPHLPQDTLQQAIAPAKDIEGVHPYNLGLVVYGTALAAPCTALAALALLQESGQPLRGKEAVIVGRSEIVGTPLALLLLRTLGRDSPTVTVCHTGTQDLAFHLKRADVVVAAAGRPEMIHGSQLKPGAIVVDVGIHRVPALDPAGNAVLNDQGKPKKKTVGDVHFASAAEVSSFITPVPGGVGPVTVAMLLKKAVEYRLTGRS